MAETHSDDISPDTLIDQYTCAYRMVYDTQPRIRYMGNQWFIVNAEIVHYRIMLDQVDQLRALAKRKRMHSSNKSVISRLIDKLRGTSV